MFEILCRQPEYFGAVLSLDYDVAVFGQVLQLAFAFFPQYHNYGIDEFRNLVQVLVSGVDFPIS